MTNDGYRELRDNLRTSLGVGEIRAHRTALTALLRRLIDEVSDPILRAALSGVLSAVSDFMEAALTCADTSIERSVLIEKQIDQLEFVGELHDQYHDVCRRLESHYHSVVQGGKRLANSIARLVYELLPHEQRRGIRPGSFGRMYGRFSGLDEGLAEPLETARSLITEHGEFLESVVHEYRDDVIEHIDPRSDVDLAATLTSDDRVDIMRPVGDPDPGRQPDYTLDPNWPGFMYQDFWRLDTHPDDPEFQMTDGDLLGYRFQVHMHAIFDFEDGQQITAGTPIAFRTDFDSGHFDIHGPHSHTFSSREIPTFFANDPDVVYGMPGVTELAERYSSLTSDVLDLVQGASG